MRNQPLTATRGNHSPTTRTLNLRLRPSQGPSVTAGLAAVGLVTAGLVAFASAGSSSAAPTSYTIWPSTTVPKIAADTDKSSVELGVVFKPSTTGWVTDIRYYKSAQNTGPHTGKLWGSNGTMLAAVTFANETSSGWQQARLSAPVKVTAGSTYVASYRAPNGRYADDVNALSPTKPVTRYGLTATRGVYSYTSGMPTKSWMNANYYVDVAFTTVAPAGAPPPSTTSGATSTATSTATTTTKPPTSTATSTATTTTKPPTSTATSTATTTTKPPTSTATSTATTTTKPPTSTATSTATTTTKPPTTTTAPSTTGTPNADNTGVPAGTTLKDSGSVTVSTDGAVISGLNVKGTVTISASNVTLKNSRITGKGFAIVRVSDSAKNVTVQDVEIDGLGFSGEGNSMGVIGPATVQRADITGVENGLTPGSGSVLRDNWIHGLAAPGSPHIDGVQIDGGLSNIRVEHNNIDMHEWTQTSAVMIDNYFGPINGVTVNDNLLVGGGYTAYSDGQFSGGTIQNVSFTNNRMGRGYYGYASIVKNSPVWSGNTDSETGATISR